MGSLRLLSLLVASLLAAHGQLEKQSEFTISAHSELVLLDVSVKEAKGGYVSNLKKENFQVYENGKLQAITQFGREDTPVTVGLVIDDSRSMGPKRQDVATAALALVDASNPRDEVFVTHFNDRVRHGLPEGTDFSDEKAGDSFVLDLDDTTSHVAVGFQHHATFLTREQWLRTTSQLLTAILTGIGTFRPDQYYQALSSDLNPDEGEALEDIGKALGPSTCTSNLPPPLTPSTGNSASAASR